MRCRKVEKDGTHFLDALPPWTRLGRAFSDPETIGPLAVGMMCVSIGMFWSKGWLAGWLEQLIWFAVGVLLVGYGPLVGRHGLSSWQEPLRLSVWSDDPEALYRAVASFWEGADGSALTNGVGSG